MLDQVPSKYTLVHLVARRAREINAYYHSLGEGLGQYTPPLVEQVHSNKPLSIALAEIASGKIAVQTAADARRMAEELLSAEVAGQTEEAQASEAEEAKASEAAVYPLETEGEDEGEALDTDAGGPGEDEES